MERNAFPLIVSIYKMSIPPETLQPTPNPTNQQLGAALRTWLLSLGMDPYQTWGVLWHAVILFGCALSSQLSWVNWRHDAIWCSFMEHLTLFFFFRRTTKLWLRLGYTCIEIVDYCIRWPTSFWTILMHWDVYRKHLAVPLQHWSSWAFNNSKSLFD